MTRGELVKRMTADEFVYWQAIEQTHPALIDDHVIAVLLGRIVQLVSNFGADPKEPGTHVRLTDICAWIGTQDATRSEILDGNIAVTSPRGKAAVALMREQRAGTRKKKRAPARKRH